MGVIENRIDITELERSGGGGGGGTAASVSYDNTSSGLTATTVQGAIDEVVGDIGDLNDEKAGKDQISNRNLLDNGWFTVNQRGVSSSNGGYTVDRWTGRNTTEISISDNIVTLVNNRSDGSSWFGQHFELTEFNSLIGKTLTLSFMLSNGEMKSWTFIFQSGRTQSDDFVLDNASVYLSTEFGQDKFSVLIWLRYPNDTISIKALKLEIGSISTLALDTAPNYAEELLKCQRYFQRIYTNNSYGFLSSLGFVITTSQARFPVLLSAPLRTAPTITSGGSLRIAKTSTITSTITNISVTTFSGNMVWVALDTSDTLTVGDECMISANNDATAHIDLSADL